MERIERIGLEDSAPDHFGTGEMSMWSLMAARSVHLVFCCRDKIIIVGSQLVGLRNLLKNWDHEYSSRKSKNRLEQKALHRMQMNTKSN